MSELVSYELEDDVAHITFSDGKVNVMSIEMMREIDSALERAEAEAGLVVLRSGQPGIFSAGFDLKMLSANDVSRSIAMVRSGGRLALRLLSLPLPTVGVMAGHAFPMGTFLLLACDLRIGARGPHRMGLNEATIGIVPPGFAIELARSRLHPAWLSRTVTLGEMYEPDAALEAGFLDLVVAPEEVEETVAERVAWIRDNVHRQAHSAAKQRLRAGTMMAMQQSIDTELTADAFRSVSD